MPNHTLLITLSNGAARTHKHGKRICQSKDSPRERSLDSRHTQLCKKITDTNWSHMCLIDEQLQSRDDLYTLINAKCEEYEAKSHEPDGAVVEIMRMIHDMIDKDDVFLKEMSERHEDEMEAADAEAEACEIEMELQKGH